MLEALKADIEFGVFRRPAWERFAIVTDLAWVDKLVRLMSWLIPGEMRVFPTAELNTAKEWVAGSARRHCRSSVPISQASGRLPTGPVPRIGDRPQSTTLAPPRSSPQRQRSRRFASWAAWPRLLALIHPGLDSPPRCPRGLSALTGGRRSP